MECRTPNDVYLLLKSSDFITHDLEHAFDDCESDSGHNASNSDDPTDSSETETRLRASGPPDISYHLVLRKAIPSMTTSLEFRCFVRARHLLCIYQRDLDHYAFLDALKTNLLKSIQQIFKTKLQKSFPEDSFVFDVYISPPHGKVWLIDIKLEILEMVGGEQGRAIKDQEDTDSNKKNDKDDLKNSYLSPNFGSLDRTTQKHTGSAHHSTVLTNFRKTWWMHQRMEDRD